MIRPTPLFTIVFCFFVALNTTTNARTLGASAMGADHEDGELACLLYTSPSPRDGLLSRMPSSA